MINYDFSQHNSHHYEKYEYSYGLIAVTETLDKILIVKHRNNIWGFPKGHQNDNESAEQTVAREMEEELGLKINLENEKVLGTVDFKFAYRYNKYLLNKHIKEQILKKERPYWNKVGSMVKKVVLYIVLIPEDKRQIKPDSEEILNYSWVTLNTAEQMLFKDKSYHLSSLIEARDIISEYAKKNKNNYENKNN